MLKRSLIGLIGIVALWSAAVHIFEVPDFLLPGPWAVAQRIVFLFQHANLLWHIYVTLSEILGGFLLGAVVGVASAIAFSRSPLLSARWALK